MIETILKRDGSREPFQPEKLNGWAIWAAQHLGGHVDWAGIAMRAVASLPAECSSQELQLALIQECKVHQTWSHYRMAARLYITYIRKQMYGGDGTVPHIREIHKELQKWDLMKVLDYSDQEYDQIEQLLEHKRDFNYAEFQIKQIIEKYSLCDRRVSSDSEILGRYFESPQHVYMRMAMALAEREPRDIRMYHLSKWYSHLSCNRLNAPTPNFANLGTSHNGLASCFPAGSLVTTRRGRVPIEDIVVGDEVLTHTNQYRKVYHTQNKPYAGKFVRLNTAATLIDEFNPTEEHRIWAIKAMGANALTLNNERGGHEYLYHPGWIASDNIRVGDYVKLTYDDAVDESPLSIWNAIKDVPDISSRYELQGSHIVPIYKWRKGPHTEENRYPPILNIDIMNSDLFRFFGYYLAEGCVCSPSRESYCKHLIFTFNTKEKDYVEDVSAIATMLGARVSVSYNPTDNSTKVTIHSKPLTELLDALFGSGFNTKRLPEIVMRAPIHLQKQLFYGLIRGDGCAIVQGYTLTLSNVEIMCQLRDLALRCRLHISFTKARKPKPGETAPRATLIFNVAGTNFARKVGKDLHKSRSERSYFGANVLFLDDGAYGRVRAISSYDSECTVYDLSIVEDASFNVNGIAVHNCCLIAADDTEIALGISDYIARAMTVASAGIGTVLMCRSIGDPVRGGSIVHQGKVGYYRALAGAVNSSIQNGRGGACTTYFSCYDPEVMTLMNLRHPKSPEAQRILTMDFAVELNKHIYRKAAANQDIFTFNAYTAPDLARAFYDPEPGLFEAMYEKYENDHTFKKEYISARKILIASENIAIETGSLYQFYADEANRHTPFYDPIYSSNLCVEIYEPTAPYFALTQLSVHGPVATTKTRSKLINALSDDDDSLIGKSFTHVFSSPDRVHLLHGMRPAKAAQELKVGDHWVNPDGEWEVTDIPTQETEPEVALCSLAAIVPSYIESEEQYAEVAYYALKMIDVCIHLADFPIPHIAYTARQRLSAGVGLTGVAHYMAKKRKRYTTIDGKQELHRLAERHAYHLIQASLRLGKELGNAPWIHRTKWPEGWLPLDTYCRKVDEIADFENQYDWEQLRQEIIENGGIRNSTLIAHMPTESSSKASGVPNGLYPIRDFALGKSDNGAMIDWAPTDGDKLKRYYDIAWDIPINDQADLYAIMQKWTDQGISSDNWIRLEGDSTVWTRQLLEASMYKARLGQKGRYYFHSKTSKTIVNEATGETTIVTITTDHNTADKCVSGGCDA